MSGSPANSGDHRPAARRQAVPAASRDSRQFVGTAAIRQQPAASSAAAPAPVAPAGRRQPAATAASSRWPQQQPAAPTSGHKKPAPAPVVAARSQQLARNQHPAVSNDSHLWVFAVSSCSSQLSELLAAASIKWQLAAAAAGSGCSQ